MSSGGRYVRISFPKAASISVDSPAPSTFLTAMMSDDLRHGLPASRTGGAAFAWAARRGLPSPAFATVLRRLPSRRQPELDALLERVATQWPRLAAESGGLPDGPPPLTALAVERSAARTVFVFGTCYRPLLVIKQPRGDGRAVRTEAAALVAAAPARVAPKLLGWLDGASVQEGLPGRPPCVAPVSVADAAHMSWSVALEDLSGGVRRLAEITTQRLPAPDRLLKPLDDVLAGDFPGIERRQLRAVRQDLGRLDVCVLQHADLRSQNWLLGPRGALEGIVDWELANPTGTPGFDVWQATLSLLEEGVGLAGWSQRTVAEAFRTAWMRAPLFDRARAAARECALAAGVAERFLDPLEVAFFARHLGRRLANPAGHAVKPRASAEMLAVVCAS